MANIKLTTINPTGGYIQPTINTDVVQNLGKIELDGVGGVALTTNGADITGLPNTPSGPTAAASKFYVDSLVNTGTSWIQPVIAVATGYVNPSGNATVDGVALTTGDRVLLTNQQAGTSAAQNGVYDVDTAGAWARTSDVLQDGMAMFVMQGTVYAGTQWVLTTNNPITPDVTLLTFAQFGGGTTYSAGNGLALAGTVFSVDLATVSGLEFSGTELQIDVASTDELSIDANGLNVEGLPSLFKVNGSAVSANVTAANLDALTGNGIISIHGHSAIGLNSIQTSAGVALGDPIIISGIGTAEKGAASNPTTAGVVGVAAALAAPSAIVSFQTHGVVSGLTGLTPGVPYYLGDTGGLAAYSAVTSGYRAIRIGFAASASDLIVNVQDMGIKP